MPRCTNLAVFFNIVLNAFDPPTLFLSIWQKFCVNFMPLPQAFTQDWDSEASLNDVTTGATKMSKKLWQNFDQEYKFTAHICGRM